MPKTEDDCQTQTATEKATTKGSGSVTFDTSADNPLTNKDAFKNRRYMAWTSLVSMILLTLIILLLVKPEHVGSYDALFGWVYGTFSAVILAYMGATTVGYMSFLRSNKTDGK